MLPLQGVSVAEILKTEIYTGDIVVVLLPSLRSLAIYYRLIHNGISRLDLNFEIRVVYGQSSLMQVLCC